MASDTRGRERAPESELINDLRKRRSRPPLTLAQTGGEGEVSSTVGAELGALGWSSTELNTSRHDDEHLDSNAGQPPGDAGRGGGA